MSTPDLTPPGPPIEPAPTPATAPDQPYGQALPPMPWGYGVPLPVIPPRAPRGLAITSLVLAGGIAVLDVLSAVVATLMDGDDLDASYVYGLLSYGLLATVSLLLLIAAYIVTCLWLVQCRKFAAAHGTGESQRHGDVWLWLGWWVPIASFFVPCQVVRDVYRSTRGWASTSGLVSLWWFLWLAYNIVSFFWSDSNDGLPSATSAALNALLAVSAFACWATLVRRIDGAQAEQEREFASVAVRA